MGTDLFTVTRADKWIDVQFLRGGVAPVQIGSVNARVIDLTVVKIGEAPRTVLRDLPALVRAEDLTSPVAVDKLQIAEQRLTVGRELGSGLGRVIHMGAASDGPAARDHGQQLMLSPRQICRFTADILQMGAVIGETGRKIIVMQTLPIQPEVENAHGRCKDLQ